MGLKQKQDFMTVVKQQLTCSDFDAEHPVWIYLIDKLGLDREQSLWFSLLYMAYYDEASAWHTFNNSDPFTVPKIAIHLPIGKNRRNLWGGRIVQHFASLASERKKASDWPCHEFGGDRLSNWDALRKALKGVWGNGRFGVFTTAEMLHKVNGLDVEVGGFDNQDSSGPADGIIRIYDCSSDVPTLDRFAEMTYQRVLRTGMKPKYSIMDRGVVESILCNYSGICRGVYYSGRNIDRQQVRIQTVESLVATSLPDLWEARKAVFRPCDLGELNGWKEIDKNRLKLYQLTGELPWASEKR